uniref:Uncharacterized protein n=1 Tax=Amphimedon queenslandica TaxID=400682 RepID=A0A1X7UFZ7_AMPQE
YPGRHQGGTYGCVIDINHNDISSYCADSVSFICGPPCQHFRTLMARLNEANTVFLF